MMLQKMLFKLLLKKQLWLSSMVVWMIHQVVIWCGVKWNRYQNSDSLQKKRFIVHYDALSWQNTVTEWKLIFI